ncbi:MULTISPECIES: hypothetical protein [unclassified Clostridium]|uniref:hypothetical protein n=1 Tax=unclassified Clostridium TaxID=2614128 RepID=UPI0002982C1D|nr:MULTISPECIES: hypothetical protein [unclassified Clostridium]EKQ56291.1 MAG: hypothetical protein A370_02047 [Clostridium sp. Maddingley MBC34-26]
MKKLNILEGQIDLFNMPIQEPIIKPKEKVIVEKQEIKEDYFQNIINLYKESCNRIIKTVSGALLVELEDKTKYFNGQGVHEFDLGIDIGLIPADEILIVNQDKHLNEIQLKKLEEINPNKYIKRKGDANIIIPGDKTTVITPRGWIIEWDQKPLYKEDEVVLRTIEIKVPDQNLNAGDIVEFEYAKETYKGKIVSIYNNGETINVVWNGKHTAFYYKCVRKIA